MSTPEVGATDEQSRPFARLMLETSARVVINRKPGVNTYSGWLADLRHGITRNGEAHAIRSAGPYLGGLPAPRAKSGAMRAAAIRAIHKDAPTTKQTKLGTSFARLAKQEGGSSIERQVGALPLLDLETAAATFDSLIGRCAKAGIPVNFVSLARTLVRWGTGATVQAQAVRSEIVLDFYAASAPDLESSPKPHQNSGAQR